MSSEDGTLELSEWIAADSGPPYSVAAAFARASDAGAPKSFLLKHLSVLAWDSDRTDAEGVAAIVPGAAALPDRWRALADAARDSRVLVVLDGRYDDPGRSHEACQRMLALRDGLLRLCDERGGLVRPAEYAAVAAVDTIPLRVRVSFVRATLGPILRLPAERAHRLVETLDAVAAGYTSKRLAATLHLHTQTVTYRKARIAWYTGLHPRQPRARSRLLLALFLWKFDIDHHPPMGSTLWPSRA